MVLPGPAPAPEDEHKHDEDPSRWAKTWIFMLALLCLLSLGGLGTWGRVRMLEDDNGKLAKQLQHETFVHEEVEQKWKNRLRHKTTQVGNIRREIAVAVGHFKELDTSMKHFKGHITDSLEHARTGPSQFVEDCKGVIMPHGFQVQVEGQPIFPYDVSGDATGLYALLNSNPSFQTLLNVTQCAQKAGLFSQVTFPWAQWTWLTAMLEQPHLSGNFTEWGLGAGGSSMFLTGLASMRKASLAGFENWEGGEGPKRIEQFGHAAQQCGLPSPVNAELFNLSTSNIVWPKEGHVEQLAFTHIDTDDYRTTLGIMSAVYNSTVDGGMIAVDNFFHPSGGSKSAVDDFFRVIGKRPLLYPVFPGYSVLLFKNRFANVKDGAITPNALDGNYYNFKYIKGQPLILDSLNRSVTRLAAVHAAAKNDTTMNTTALCWLSAAFHNARSLRDLALSSDEQMADMQATDMYRFLAGNTQFTAAKGVV